MENEYIIFNENTDKWEYWKNGKLEFSHYSVDLVFDKSGFFPKTEIPYGNY